MRRVVVALVVLGLVGAVAAVVWWQSDRGTRLQQAISQAPEAERLSWTDWAGVRREVGEASIRSSPDQVSALLDRAFERDLTAMSALVESTPVLHGSFGLSPATIDWELFAQSEQGAVVILGLSESFDLAAFADRLEALGFDRPEESDGVWRGGADLLAGLGADLTPEMQNFAIDADERVVRASDSAEHLEDVLGADGAGDVFDPVAERLGSPLAAALQTGPHACTRLAMSQAADDDRARGEALVEAAGEISPLTGFAMGVRADGDIRTVLAFETDDQARANADSRAVLAAGEAPGQGGSFADRFEVASVQARDTVVVMDLAPVEGAYVLSDLTSGPVLFATC